MPFLAVSTPTKSLEVSVVLRRFKLWHIDQTGCTLSNNGHLKAKTCSMVAKNSFSDKSSNTPRSLIQAALTLEFQRKLSIS